MAITIRNGSVQAGAVPLGDLKRRDFFVFASSDKDVPNLYQYHGGMYSRIKTGELFNVTDSPMKRGSAKTEMVYRVDVDITYTKS